MIKITACKPHCSFIVKRGTVRLTVCNYELQNMHILTCGKNTVKRWKIDHAEK